MTDLLIHNAYIRTLDESNPIAKAMAVADGKILYVGDEAIARQKLGLGAQEVDASGRTVMPGFVDAHTHVELISYSLHLWEMVRGLSRPQILHRLAQLVAEKPPGEWIVLQGTFGQDFPDLSELDALAPEHPVALRWTMHKFQANSMAMRVSGIDRSTEPGPGMRISRDEKGDPSGLMEEAWDLLTVPPMDEALLEKALLATLEEHFLANGVTTVHEIVASREGVRAYQRLARRHTIPRIGLAFTAAPGHQPLGTTEDILRLGLGTRFGDERVWFQAVKIFLDGGRDGAFRTQLLDKNAHQWGLPTRSVQELAREVTEATKNGVQVYMHAIGDLAQQIAVAAVETASTIFQAKEHRLRIEHMFNEHFDTALLERLVAAGGLAVPNPGFVWAEPDDPAKRLPDGATKYAIRTLKQVQGRVPGNSDTAGAQPMTTNPWFTIQCMMQLKNENGVRITPGEEFGIDDAVRAYTLDSAYATFAEKSVGSLEPGKHADFVVLEQNPYELEVEEIHTVTTSATVIAGELIYGQW